MRSFPAAGCGGDEAGRLKVSWCVCIVHEDFDGWPVSSVPPRWIYLDPRAFPRPAQLLVRVMGQVIRIRAGASRLG